MIKRLEAGIIRHDNDQMYISLRNRYPFAYEIATTITPIIYKERGIIVPENELIYIAVYMAMILDSQRARVKAVLVGGGSNTMLEILKRRIEEYFYTRIEIVGAFPVYLIDEVAKDIDLLIVTKQIDKIFDIRWFILMES